MPFENSAGIKVLNNYGPRAMRGKSGAVSGSTNNLLRTAIYDLGFADIPSTSVLQDKTGLDIVFPTGTKFVRSYLIGKVILAGNSVSGVNIGTYTFDAVGALTVNDADSIHVVAVAVVADFGTGKAVAGTGAMLGVAGLVTTAPLVIRVLPVTGVPTSGSFRLVVEYYAPAPIAA